MAKKSVDERTPIGKEDVQGLKYFRKLWPLFERLHDIGCQRDKAGNRELFMDRYCGLVLPFLFNSCVRSLRTLQQASQLKNVQRQLGCGRASLVAFDANRYSVPVKHAHRPITIAATVDEVRLIDGDQLVARHERCWKREQNLFDPVHYLVSGAAGELGGITS